MTENILVFEDQEMRTVLVSADSRESAREKIADELDEDYADGLYPNGELADILPDDGGFRVV